MMDPKLYHDVEISSCNGCDDINNSSDINKRKRQHRHSDSEYGDDKSDYEQEPRELRPIRPRPIGRPRGSKNKPKSVPAQYDHNNQLIQELPQHVPSLVLSSYTIDEETFDIMIKVSDNMSLQSLKQECEARGYTYKKSKSVTKEDLLFILGPGTVAMHMTKVYDDYQILSARLKKIDEENERIKTENDQQKQRRLKNIREEAKGSVSNSTNVQRKHLDRQRRERSEREQREVIPPNHQMWVMPPVLPNGFPPVPNVHSSVSNVHPPVPNSYQMPSNVPPVYYHHMYPNPNMPNMRNMPNHTYPNHQMWGMPYYHHMYPNH